MANMANITRITRKRKSSFPKEAKPSRVDVARDYLDKGWKPLPIKHGKKNPFNKDWPEMPVTHENVADLFKDDYNI